MFCFTLLFFIIFFIGVYRLCLYNVNRYNELQLHSTVQDFRNLVTARFSKSD